MSQSSVLPTPGTTAKAQRTKQGLLRAAERVFGAKGFDAASIADITQAAGVAQGTFYLYFADKKAAFLALVDELGRELRAALRAATDGAGPRLEVERVGFLTFFRFVAEHRDLYRIVRQAEFVDAGAYRAYYERLAAGYARGLRRAMLAREIRHADPERLAWSLMGIADFLGLRWVLWEQDVDAEGLTAAAMDLLHEGLAHADERHAKPAAKPAAKPPTKSPAKPAAKSLAKPAAKSPAPASPRPRAKSTTR